MSVFIGYALIALLVAGLLCYGVIALLPEGLSMRPERDRPLFELPTGRRLVRADLDRVRIPVSLRGYRFAETDDLIDRLAAELVVRDEEIERLRAALAFTDRDERLLDVADEPGIVDDAATEPADAAEPAGAAEPADAADGPRSDSSRPIDDRRNS